MAVAEDEVTALANDLAKTLTTEPVPAVSTVISLAETLAQSPFKIFGQVEDLGFFKWRQGTQFKLLENAQESDFLDRVTLDAKPPQVLPVKNLNDRLPLTFATKRGRGISNKFPFDGTYLPALYATVKRRSAGLQDIDFVFGGSTLHYFETHPSKSARGSSSSKAYVSPNQRGKQYVAMLVPGSKAVLVARCGSMNVNHTEVGYQFERFTTGGAFKDKSDFSVFEHLQVIDIGPGYRTLFSAESDAVDADGNSVEVKSGNPRYFATKLPLQMISSGSAWLYAANKHRDCLRSVKCSSLSEVIDRQCSPGDVRRIESRILDAMRKLKQVADEGRFEGGKTAFSLSFENDELELQAMHRMPQALPSEAIVRAVLRPVKDLSEQSN